jgi:hypothetical protein
MKSLILTGAIILDVLISAASSGHVKPQVKELWSCPFCNMYGFTRARLDILRRQVSDWHKRMCTYGGVAHMYQSIQ